MSIKRRVRSRIRYFMILSLLIGSPLAKALSPNICLDIFQKKHRPAEILADELSQQVQEALSIEQKQIISDVKKKLASSPIQPTARMIEKYDIINLAINRAMQLKSEHRRVAFKVLLKMWKRIVAEEWILISKSSTEGVPDLLQDYFRYTTTPFARLPGLTSHEVVKMELLSILASIPGSPVSDSVSDLHIQLEVAVSSFGRSNRRQSLIKSNTKFSAMGVEQLQKTLEALRERHSELQSQMVSDVVKQLDLVAEYQTFKAGLLLKQETMLNTDRSSLYSDLQFWSTYFDRVEAHERQSYVQMADVVVARTKAYHQHRGYPEISEMNKDINTIQILLEQIQ